MAVPTGSPSVGVPKTGAMLAAALAGVLSLAVIVFAADAWVQEVRPGLGWLAAAVGSGTVVAGCVGRRRRPDSVVGPLLVVSGLLFLVGRFWWSSMPWAYTTGVTLQQAHLAVLAHAGLALPTGHLDRLVDRAVIGFVYVDTLAGAGLWLLFERCPYPSGCPANVVALWGAPDLRAQLGTIADYGAVVGALAVLGALALRVVRGHSALRRALLPAVLGLLGRGLLYVVPLNLGLIDYGEWYDVATAALVPIGLTVGLLRGRAGLGRVGRFALEVDEAHGEADSLRVGLAHTLGDPTLDIVYASSAGWADEHGNPTIEPTSSRGRALLPVTDADGDLRAIVEASDHVLDEPALVAGATAIARLVLDNRRLASEVEAQLEDVRASRVRMVRAKDDERRRIERNLHDGAQQHLLSVALTLRLAQEADDGYAHLEASAGEAVDEIERAVRELQELGRGLHPTVLTDKGLTAAVRALTTRSGVPVTVRMADYGPGALPDTVATTAYYVIAEALANTTKHARATHAHVLVNPAEPGRLRVEALDDGVGGAQVAAGTGLQGLRDRVEAADGLLLVDSPPGSGTIVTAILRTRP